MTEKDKIAAIATLVYKVGRITSIYSVKPNFEIIKEEVKELEREGFLKPEEARKVEEVAVCAYEEILKELRKGNIIEITDAVKRCLPKQKV